MCSSRSGIATNLGMSVAINGSAINPQGVATLMPTYEAVKKGELKYVGEKPTLIPWSSPAQYNRLKIEQAQECPGVDFHSHEWSVIARVGYNAEGRLCVLSFNIASFQVTEDAPDSGVAPTWDPEKGCMVLAPKTEAAEATVEVTEEEALEADA